MTKTTSRAAVSTDASKGYFADSYLIYCRKSTDEAESQKNSIAYQGREIKRYCQSENLKLAAYSQHGFSSNGIISEKHSGFKESDTLTFTDDGMVQFEIERPKFQKLLQHLNKGHFKGVICLCWDRISRNKGDDTVIRKLMRQGVEFRFVYANYDNSSSGELHMDIDGMFSAHHSRVTSEKVKASTKLKRSEGKCTYRAPIGYLNTGSIDKKPLDPERAPIIKDLFELYATGSWSIPDLTRYAEEQGLRTVPARPKRTPEEMMADTGEGSNMHEKVSKPLRANRIGRILRDPFYKGLIIGPDGTHIASTCHEALVTPETFAKVQTILSRKRVSKYYEKKQDQPFRGFVRCAVCRRAYSPYVKKGILYYSSKCLPDCANQKPSINYDFVDRTIHNALRKLTLTDDEAEILDATATTELSLLETRRKKEQARRDRKTSAIKEDLSYLRVHQLTLLKTGAYTPETLQSERIALEAKLDDLDAQAANSEQSMRSMIEDVLKYSELLKNITGLYENANRFEKEAILQKVSVELLIDENTAQLSPQVGLEPVFRLKKLICEQKNWFSELCEFLNQQTSKQL